MKVRVQSVLALAGGFADIEVYEVCAPVERDTLPLAASAPKSQPRHLRLVSKYLTPQIHHAQKYPQSISNLKSGLYSLHEFYETCGLV